MPDPDQITEALHKSKISSTDAKVRTVETFKTQARQLADTMELLMELGMDMEVSSTLEKLRSPSSGKERLRFTITVEGEVTGRAPSPATAKSEIHCEICGEPK